MDNEALKDKVLRLQKIREQIKALQMQLHDETPKAYPVGLKLSVTLGIHRVDGEVVRHNSWWWSNPGSFVIRNLKTGKQREVSAFDMEREYLGKEVASHGH